VTQSHPFARVRRQVRRGFNLIELLIALSITGLLLAATMVALDASYTAYQKTTLSASTHNISRITMDRILTLVRTGVDFGPKPADPNTTLVHSNLIEVITATGQGITIEWDETNESLLLSTFDPETGNILQTYQLLDGVIPNVDPVTGETYAPFTLEFELGQTLRRATVDLTIVPHDNQSVEIERGEPYQIRLVGSAMPRDVACGAKSKSPP